MEKTIYDRIYDNFILYRYWDDDLAVWVPRKKCNEANK